MEDIWMRIVENQIIVEGFVYPGEVLIVAFVLAIVPYLILRGPVNRIARIFRK